MKRLAVVPNDPIEHYLVAGYSQKWLREYFNPAKYFDEVYVLSPFEQDNPDLLGMKAVHTPPEMLGKRLKELKIDVVRAYGGARPCEIACRNKVRGIPVIVSVHDTHPDRLRVWIDKADVVWCMSEAVKKLVLTKFTDEARVWILPNRIHFETMRPYSKSETRDLDHKYPFKYKIIHVGRKEKQKNLDNTIKALRILGKDYCLLAVGKGDAQKYIDIAEQEGVRERCFFIEAIQNEELARYFSWADCMCTPSRWEGFGMVFTEALACRGVVVTSDIEPMNTYIKHKTNGLLIKDYENPQAIAQLVLKACSGTKLRKIIKQNARESVEKFDQRKIDALEVDLYKKVLQMRDEGQFKMSLKDQLIMSPVGSRINAMIPKSAKKVLIKTLRKS